MAKWLDVACTTPLPPRLSPLPKLANHLLHYHLTSYHTYPGTHTNTTRSSRPLPPDPSDSPFRSPAPLLPPPRTSPPAPTYSHPVLTLTWRLGSPPLLPPLVVSLRCRCPVPPSLPALRSRRSSSLPSVLTSPLPPASAPPLRLPSTQPLTSTLPPRAFTCSICRLRSSDGWGNEPPRR